MAMWGEEEKLLVGTVILCTTPKYGSLMICWLGCIDQLSFYPLRSVGQRTEKNNNFSFLCTEDFINYYIF
jgi:hypothetical protein